jgi:outer membrane cobalamin receptor
MLTQFVILSITAALGAQVATPPIDRTVTGVLRDEQGAVIQRARVEITCGGQRWRTTSGPTGEFSQTGLPAQRCTVAAESPLFDRAQTAVDLAARTTAKTTLVLHVRGFVTEVIVTATRGVEEDPHAIPQSTTVVTRSEINSRPYQLLPQVLREEPGILLQQTTSAQTSPTIRGFTGQSNVYLIDGVRFNTASWRGGPSQYLGWIDGAAVDRLEIVRGPGSVQYGSDALGGTINVLTGRPAFSAAGTRFGGDADVAIGSADGSVSTGADLAVHSASAAFKIGGTTRRVTDLRGGGGIDSHNAVTRFLGLPSSTIDSRMRDTGYEQSGGYFVGRFRAGDRGTIDTIYMHENQTGASRYDRIYGGDGLYRSGFDPQTLDFGLLRYERRATAVFDSLSATFSINRQSDGRFEQTRPTAILDRQRATTTAYGYQLQGQRQLRSRHRLSVGTEVYDEGISGAFREQVNTTTRASVPQRPDIPDGTTYRNVGAFVQDVTDLIPGRLNIRGGVRYGHFGFSTTANPSLGVADEHVAMQAVTFQAGTVLTLTRHVNATFSASRGFRAANAADLGSIGLSGGGGFGITPSRAAAL